MTQLRILGAGPVKRGVTQLAAQFEKSTGHGVAVEFTAAPSARERVLAGEVVDVVVVPQAAMDDFVLQSRVAVDTRMSVGRSRMGIVVRKGAPAPDLSSADAFKQAMLGADAIVCNLASSGAYMVKLLDKLGIAEATRDKVIRLADAVKVMEYVAGASNNALGAGQLSEIRELADKGVSVVLAAPLPDAIQNVTAYDVAVASASREQGEAAALARFLTAPEARAVLAATGID
jgi:molybdate transport system substrate-binding protein